MTALSAALGSGLFETGLTIRTLYSVKRRADIEPLSHCVLNRPLLVSHFIAAGAKGWVTNLNKGGASVSDSEFGRGGLVSLHPLSSEGLSNMDSAPLYCQDLIHEWMSSDGWGRQAGEPTLMGVGLGEFRLPASVYQSPNKQYLTM